MAKRRKQAALDQPTPAEIKVIPSGSMSVRRVPLALARHFHQICIASIADAMVEAGLKSGQFAVLVYLSRVTGEPGIDTNTLPAGMGYARARVSQLADELETLGLLDRGVNGADRRARVLQLTRRGEELRARLQPALLANLMGVLAPLQPHERELLLDLLVRVIDGNRGLAHPGAFDKQRARQSSSNNKRRQPKSNRT